LQLFAHSETSEEFSIISVIIFEVNIVAEQKQALLITIFLFFKVYIALNSSTAPLQTFRCVPRLFTLSETIVFISSAMADQRMR